MSTAPDTALPAVRRAVVCDDDPVAREVVAMVLASEGVVVVAEAGRGVDAISLVADTEPDAVVLDIGLPDMSGLDVLASLRAAAPDAAVVVFSASDTVRDAALRLGAVEVLQKTDAPELGAAVVRAIAATH